MEGRRGVSTLGRGVSTLGRRGVSDEPKGKSAIPVYYYQSLRETVSVSSRYFKFAQSTSTFIHTTYINTYIHTYIYIHTYTHTYITNLTEIINFSVFAFWFCISGHLQIRGSGMVVVMVCGFVVSVE